MSCTTILIGKKATYDGSTIIARNDDAPNGSFAPKRFAVVQPDEQPRRYKSVLGHFELDLPNNPMRYTSVPNVLPDEGTWAAAGVNEANVGMNATETITSNERVLAADPLVPYEPACGIEGEPGYVAEKIGGLGEEDIVTLVLPYIRTAREGVLRLGSLLEQLGTYEMNGIAFHDTNEIWWLETIGGHHWIARRVPDDSYVVMPNQLGIDQFDLVDAEGKGINYLCSADLRSFITTNHLDLALDPEGSMFNPRWAFGSATDNDHVYNTPRAWAIQRHFNPRDNVWDSAVADYAPTSDDIPWCRKPARKLTMEDVKYALSLHYQGTPYDPYGRPGTPDQRGLYRTVGINRTDQLSATQLRGGAPSQTCAIHWIAFGSNVFNAFVPLFANVDTAPAYLSNTDATVSTESFYWANRLIGALSDAHYAACLPHVQRYQAELVHKARHILAEAEKQGTSREEANEQVARLTRTLTDALLNKVLYEASMGMRNAFFLSDN